MASNEEEEFEFRLRAEKEAARKNKPPKGSSRAPGPMDIPGSEGATLGNSKVNMPIPYSSPMEKLAGALEAGTAIATSIPAGLLGGATELLARRGRSSGKYDEEAAKLGNIIEQKRTFSPKTSEGKRYLSSAGEFLDESKIAGLMGIPVGELGAAARITRPELRAGLARIPETVRQLPELRAGLARIPETVRQLPGVRGPLRKAPRGQVGAAATDEGLLRAQRAEDFPIPVKLTKGQKSRDFEQQKFERETAKLPEGEALRQRFAEQNAQIPRIFDAFIDEVGAKASSLREIGKIVDKSLVDKVAKFKAAINKAYEEARASGELNILVPGTPLREYITKNFSSEKNAPILGVVDKELTRLSQKDNITLGDLEELRKTINANIQADTPNAVFGTQMKNVIDGMLEGQGGAKYKYARNLYKTYAKEFKDSAVISKLMKNKPGTADRAVALEDVFDHSILKGSLDDVRSIRRTLQKAGEQGIQAWKELQGQLLRHIRDAATSGVSSDIRGNPIVSSSKINTLITSLDKDGKLDFMFGKKGAQQLRDLNDLAKDIYTSPPGSVNYSNTSSHLLHVLDMATSAITGVPAPIATIATYAKRGLKSRALRKRVEESLEEGPIPPKR